MSHMLSYDLEQHLIYRERVGMASFCGYEALYNSGVMKSGAFLAVLSIYSRCPSSSWCR